jgi:hypothetical protein
MFPAKHYSSGMLKERGKTTTTDQIWGEVKLEVYFPLTTTSKKQFLSNL